jgi:hypothetical protein
MDFGPSTQFTDVVSVNAESRFSLTVLNSEIDPCLVQNDVNCMIPCRFRPNSPFVPIDSVNVKKTAQKYKISGHVIR